MATRRNRSGDALGKSTVTIEVLKGHKQGQPLVAAVVSIEGRPGTFTRSWGCYGTPLTSAVAADFIAWVNLTIRHSWLSTWGEQFVLPLAEESTP